MSGMCENFYNTEMLNHFSGGPYKCTYGFQLTFIIKLIKILNFEKGNFNKMHGYFYYVQAVMCHSVKGAKRLESSRPTHLAPAMVAKAPLIKNIVKIFLMRKNPRDII